MPTYTYQGELGRYFPTLGRMLNPGDTADLPANPGDGRWTPPDAPPPEPTAPVGEPSPNAPAAPAIPAASGAAPATTVDHQQQEAASA
ncbi:hypothetical protein [Kitasatospora sp. NBC_01266]|uniref:hypothetical protein n=1 Tax=Kitasatospora sp. NBC_01266 TaxID=2903572 RepID=UPI002E374DB2|nr:hypothetical protein [Kitasatospora sp. NBC_01266]